MMQNEIGATDTVRVLVVGLGSIGRRHARLLSERADVELWLCDVQPHFIQETRELLARPAARSFEGYGEALAHHPEVVFLCVPTSRHAEMAFQALQSLPAGSALFVEKPVTADSQSARRVIDAARDAGCLLQVGYMLRFEEGLMRIKALTAEGAVGQVVGARAMIGTYITLLNARDSDRERVSYSLLLDYTHEFDFLQWILGPVQSIIASAGQLGRLERRPRPNVFQAVLTMQSGALVQVHLDYVQYPQRRMLEICGDQGTLLYDFMAGTLQRIPHGREERPQIVEFGPVASRVDDLYRRQIEHLLQARRNHTRPLVDGEQALSALNLVEAAIRSIETDRRTAVPPLSSQPTHGLVPHN